MFSKTYAGDKFFAFSIAFFKFCGLWRPDGQSKWLLPYLYFSRFNVYFFFGWFFTISVFSSCYIFYKDGEIDRGLDWATFGLAYVTMQIKFTVLTTNEMKFRKIIKQLEMFAMRYPDKTNVNRSLLNTNRLIVIGSTLISLACVGYCAFPVVINPNRVLPIKTMFTFGLDVFKSPIYECYVIYQILGTLVNTVPSMVFDMTYVGFLLMSASIVRNLNEEMRRNAFSETLTFKEKHNVLIKYIKDHMEFVDFMNDLRDMFVGVNTLHFFYNYFTAGLTLFQVSKQQIGSLRFFSMMSGCSSVVFQLVTFCEAGQKIADEMAKFWENLYLTDWYTQPIKFRRILVFTMHCTQKDYYMVGRLNLTLSRETEKNVLQAIFTYYTCLLRLNT